MTQKQTVLAMLKAGAVTSNQFFAANLPRFSARIHELKAEGYRIEKEPIDAGFFRYRLERVRLDRATPRPGQTGMAEPEGALSSLPPSGTPSNTDLEQRATSSAAALAPDAASSLAASGNSSAQADEANRRTGPVEAGGSISSPPADSPSDLAGCTTGSSYYNLEEAA